MNLVRQEEEQFINDIQEELEEKAVNDYTIKQIEDGNEEEDDTPSSLKTSGISAGIMIQIIHAGFKSLSDLNGKTPAELARKGICTKDGDGLYNIHRELKRMGLYGICFPIRGVTVGIGAKKPDLSDQDISQFDSDDVLENGILKRINKIYSDGELISKHSQQIGISKEQILEMVEKKYPRQYTMEGKKIVMDELGGDNEVITEANGHNQLDEDVRERLINAVHKITMDEVKEDGKMGHLEEKKLKKVYEGKWEEIGETTRINLGEIQIDGLESLSERIAEDPSAVTKAIQSGSGILAVNKVLKAAGLSLIPKSEEITKKKKKGKNNNDAAPLISMDIKEENLCLPKAVLEHCLANSLKILCSKDQLTAVAKAVEGIDTVIIVTET